ncbi:MAG: hypothetical protein ACI9MR_000745 [Myxococcota bacterium]
MLGDLADTQVDRASSKGSARCSAWWTRRQDGQLVLVQPLSSVEASSSPQGGERRHAGGISSIDDAGEASKDQRDEDQRW